MYSGLDDADFDLVGNALNLLNQADADAQAALDDAVGTGFWSKAWNSTKSVVTAVDLGTIKSAVANMHQQVATMNARADKIMSDPAATHDQAVEFVKGCALVARIDQLKAGAARNDLEKLAADVGAGIKASIGDIGLGMAPIAVGVLALLYFVRR